jgi:hypothetical protein
MYTMHWFGCCHPDSSQEINRSRLCIMTFSTVSSHRCCCYCTAAATAAATNAATTIVLFVGKCFCEHGNSISQSCQLRCHFIGFFLRDVANVGSNLILLFLIDNLCCCNGGNLVPEIVAFVSFGGLTGTFVFAFCFSTAAVLLVDFEVATSPSKYCFVSIQLVLMASILFSQGVICVWSIWLQGYICSR